MNNMNDSGSSEGDRPNAKLFKVNVREARRHMATARGRSNKDSSVNIVSLVASKNILASNPPYYLQAIRSGARDSKTDSILGEADYKQIEQYAAQLLSRDIDENSFDVIVSSPTDRPGLLDPYDEAVNRRLPSAPDWSADLQLCDRDMKSNSHHSLEERTENIRSCGANWKSVGRILIIDDVISRGRTSVPLIYRIEELSGKRCEFTICAPLWIVQDSTDSWLIPATF